jgi:aldose 1-epimerase
MNPAPIELRDPVTGATARIHPAVGFNCASFVAVIDGAPVETLWSEPAFAASGDGKSTRSGIPLLFPFAGRITGGRYTWEGVERTLPSAGLNNGNAIHGFVVDLPWRVLSASATRAEAEFHGSIDAPQTLAEWPSDYRIRVAYELDGNALHCDVRIDNPGAAALPFGFGTHPYFRLPLGGDSAEACRVTVPALEYWPLVNLLPTGETQAVDTARNLRDGAPFAGIDVDDVLTSLIASDGEIVSRVLDPGSGIEVTQTWSMAFPHCVVYTAPQRESIAIEPYTTVPDAFRLLEAGIDPDLVVLQPGESWHVRITIAAAKAGA